MFKIEIISEIRYFYSSFIRTRKNKFTKRKEENHIWSKWDMKDRNIKLVMHFIKRSVKKENVLFFKKSKMRYLGKRYMRNSHSSITINSMIVLP